MNTDTKLTDDQIELINKDMEEFVESNSNLKVLADLPSNNGIEESEENLTGEFRKVNVAVNPNTGESVISDFNDEEEPEDPDESFEKMVEDIKSGKIDPFKDAPPVSKEEFIQYAKDSEDSIFGMLFGNEENFDSSVITKILEVTNRRINKENFNVYKELPEQVQDLINKSILSAGAPAVGNTYKAIRNSIAESLIDEFVTSTYFDRAKTDLNKEIETIFNESSTDIANTVIGYTADRNKALRDYAETLEDEEKKNQILSVLDYIDEAYKLTELKEFCKKFKIKHIDVEKVDDKSYKINQFLTKYDNSPYNIYSIYTAEKTMLRNINKDENDKYTEKDIRAFFLAFCEQCKNYSPSNSQQHAYMYYVIYNTVLADINSGEKKEVSDVFLNNVKECIENLKARNINVL